MAYNGGGPGGLPPAYKFMAYNMGSGGLTSARRTTGVRGLAPGLEVRLVKLR